MQRLAAPYAISAVSPFPLINQRGQQPDPAVAERVTVRDGSAVDIHAPVELRTRRHAEFNQAAERLGGKGFVVLK
jgi:hypothetical protein